MYFHFTYNIFSNDQSAKDLDVDLLLHSPIEMSQALLFRGSYMVIHNLELIY